MSGHASAGMDKRPSDSCCPAFEAVQFLFERAPRDAVGDGVDQPTQAALDACPLRVALRLLYPRSRLTSRFAHCEAVKKKPVHAQATRTCFRY